MLSLRFLRQMRVNAGTPASLRRDVAAALRAQPPFAHGVEAVVYWLGAFVLVWLAGAIGHVLAEDTRQGAVYGLLAGLALLALLLAMRHRRFGTMRPALGRGTLHSHRFEARPLRRSLLTPLRAGLMIAAAMSASLAGGGGEAGLPWSGLWVVMWTLPLALFYWALESLIAPVRTNGAHFVLPAPILIAGIAALPSPAPSAAVATLLLAAVAHVAIAVCEEM